jgi:hypothetical protein
MYGETGFSTGYFAFSGYFGADVDFVEEINASTAIANGWNTRDFTARMDEDGRVCDFLVVHFIQTAEITIGVRDGDDAVTNRYIAEHEAEGGGSEFTGFGMSAQSNSSGLVYEYASAAASARAYFMGYFLPAAVGEFSQAVGGANLAIAGTLNRKTKVTIGQGAITITGTLNRKTLLVVGAGAVTIAGSLASVKGFVQAVGGGAVTMAGSLGRVIKVKAGEGAIAIAGSLGRYTKVTVGAGAITIAGALNRLTKLAVGAGAVTMAGSLAIKTLKTVGSGAVTIAGSLGRYVKVTVGQGATTIAGSLNRLIKVSVGSGAVTMAGSLNRLIKITVGSGAVTIAGSLSSVLIGIVIYYQNVGQGAVAIAGTLNRLIKLSVGQGVVTIAGTLVGTPLRLIRFIISALKPWRFKLSHQLAMRLVVWHTAAFSMKTNSNPSMRLETVSDKAFTLRTSISRRGG